LNGSINVSSDAQWTRVSVSLPVMMSITKS
jgi:hypothetical protein